MSEHWRYEVAGEVEVPPGSLCEAKGRSGWFKPRLVSIVRREKGLQLEVRSKAPTKKLTGPILLYLPWEVWEQVIRALAEARRGAILAEGLGPEAAQEIMEGPATPRENAE